MNKYLLTTQRLIFVSVDPRNLILTKLETVDSVGCTPDSPVAFTFDGVKYIYCETTNAGIYDYEIEDPAGPTIVETGRIFVYEDECCSNNLDDIRQRSFRVYPGFQTTILKAFFENNCVLFDPIIITQVEIRTLADAVLQTITSSEISKDDIGVYRIKFEIDPGDYKDVWFYQDIPNGPILTQENFFTVLDKDTSTSCRFISPYADPGYGHGGPWECNTFEIDLREEIKGILRGGESCLPHGRKYILRRMERDERDQRIPCLCNINGIGDPDCKFCKGEYFKFTEEIIIGYLSWKTAPVGDLGVFVEDNIFKQGLAIYSKAQFYCEHFVKPKEGDRLYVIAINEKNGDVQLPVKRLKKYEIDSVFFPMSDFGRIEYYIASIEEQTK